MAPVVYAKVAVITLITAAVSVLSGGQEMFSSAPTDISVDYSEPMQRSFESTLLRSIERQNERLQESLRPVGSTLE